MGLLKDQEKTLDRFLASVRKELTHAKRQNASLRWSRGNIDEKVKTMEKDVGVSCKTVADSPQRNVSQVAHIEDVAFLQHWERLTEQAEWTKVQIVNDLKILVSCSMLASIVRLRRVQQPSPIMITR